MKNNKLQVGIIGCGNIANQKHLPNLAAIPQFCEMVAFCDIIPERAETAAKKYGTLDSKVYTDYHQLLEDKSIDVVHVLTPNVMHAPIVCDAFAAGKHVMCEKPMSHTTVEAQKMMDAWKKSGKHFTIGYQNRLRSDMRAVKQACENGEFGDIYFAQAHAVRRRAVPTWGVFMDKEKQGGGPLIDIGTHALDLTLWTMDNYEPYSVSGTTFHKMVNEYEGNMFGPWNPETFDVEDSAFGFIKMKNGALIYLEAAWALNVVKPRESCMTLCGTKGGMTVTGSDTRPYGDLIFNGVRYGELYQWEPTPKGMIDFASGPDRKIADNDNEAYFWMKSILEDTRPLVLPEQAFVVTKILDAVYESARTGREVIFEA